MKTFRAIGLAVALTAAPMALAGCASGPQASAHVIAAKSLFEAELAYNGFASAVVAAHDSGILKGDALAKAKDADNKAYAALQAARAGKGSADAVISALTAAQGVVPLPTAPAAPQ